MKLVEILARELGEWPEGASWASQDKDKEIRFDTPRFDFYAKDLADDAGPPYGDGVIVTRSMWEAERARLKGAAEWDGEGLPPVGLNCEMLWDSGSEHYCDATILAHDEGMAVYRVKTGKGKGQYGASRNRKYGALTLFRPIRTPEQVAAENREKAIIEMKEVFLRGASGIWKGARLGIEALYDAGYRKQEKGQ